MDKKFGLLGGKLGHSFSPLIHSYLGDYDYRLFEVPPDGLDSFMIARDFDGINVTIPYKQDVMSYCSTLSDEARTIGCVNTIIKDKNGDLHGHNTDYYGFKMLLKYGGFNPAGWKAVVLGDGGSARTVRAVLNDLGAKEIITVSRLGENNYSNIAKHYDAELLVNTTPVGMFPNTGILPVCIKGFTQLKAIADLVYNPSKTKIHLEAERLGVPCVNGLAMLVAQAEMASRLFLGGSDQADNESGFISKDSASDQSETELLESVIQKVLMKTLNIAIIGMPGCGKSSVGKALASELGRQLVDIDELIETASGKNIPDIFAQNGEDYFRSLESRILSDEAKKSGLVIATGGGVVTQTENLDTLRQNSVVIYLKRDLHELSINGRPLSGTVGIEELAKQRLPLYETWSDCAVESGEDEEQTASRMMEALTKFELSKAMEEK